MKLKRRIAAALLCALLATSALAGCATGSSPTSSPSPSASPSASPSPSASAPESTPSAEPIKVAMLATGAVNDGGWNQGAYMALKDIQTTFGAEINYTENISDQQMQQVLRTYASQGYNLIFGHGYQFADPMKTVAPEFPDTDFIVVNGSVSDTNVFSTNFKFGELGYFTGMTAGLMTKTNQIGMVVATDAPTNMADVDTFKLGVAAVNPGATVSVTIIGSWNDIPKAKEAANALLSSKCDVLVSQGNGFSIGVFQAAEAAGAHSIGWSDDQGGMSPSVITSGVQDIKALYLQMTDKYIKKELDPTATYTFGMKDNDAQKLGVFNDKVPQSVQDTVNQAIADYKSGKLTLDLKF